ncbi:hypothetical protein ACFV2D_36035 [Streptomyces capillispiralis]|uniref:hypothetical protein n=1 Tax=Streptomyces capillispiralis TaxID=68182 RepID=UPI0036C13307
MSEPTGWDGRLSVVADGKGLVGHAGAVLPRRCPDRTGLTAALAAVLPAGTGAGWRDRGVVVVQLAMAIVAGHLRVLGEALAQVPGAGAAKILVRIDGAGATHACTNTRGI